MEEIGFFFNFQDKVYQLPVNPEKLEVKYAGKNESKEVVALGDILVLRSRKLATLKIDSWLPEQDWYRGIRTYGQFLTASVYDEFFRMIQEGMHYMRLVVTGINLNMLVAIQSYTAKRQAGDHEDLYYSLELSEYRPYSATQVPIVNENISVTQRNVLSLGSGGTGSSDNQQTVPTQITIGSLVTVTGKLYGDSYGTDTGGRFLNAYAGRVSHINETGSHPYHITTPEGNWLGWVERQSVKIR